MCFLAGDFGENRRKYYRRGGKHEEKSLEIILVQTWRHKSPKWIVDFCLLLLQTFSRMKYRKMSERLRSAQLGRQCKLPKRESLGHCMAVKPSEQLYSLQTLTWKCSGCMLFLNCVNSTSTGHMTSSRRSPLWETPPLRRPPSPPWDRATPLLGDSHLRPWCCWLLLGSVSLTRWRTTPSRSSACANHATWGLTLFQFLKEIKWFLKVEPFSCCLISTKISNAYWIN